jgi:hypothetical protein
MTLLAGLPSSAVCTPAAEIRMVHGVCPAVVDIFGNFCSFLVVFQLIPSPSSTLLLCLGGRGRLLPLNLLVVLVAVVGNHLVEFGGVAGGDVVR